MSGLEHSFVKGFRDGNLLLYIEKHLYYKTNDREGGQKDYACYEKILDKNHKCQSRAHINAEKGCWLNQFPHRHANHEITFNDLKSLEAMRKKCRFLAENYPSANKISVREIFLSEMNK